MTVINAAKPNLIEYLIMKREQTVIKTIIFFWVVFSSPGVWAGGSTYDYPVKDPYVATIVGTPKDLKAVLPNEDDIRVREKEITIFKGRKIPDVFWYHDKLHYSLAFQKKKAPLIFNIAGTGSNYKTGKMRMMQRAFYQAGFHVVSLPSSTHTNFIVSASEKKVPGLISEDAKDYYRLMDLIYKKIKDDVEVSEFYLTGFSLGASQAAFIAKLDEKMKVFNFKKVLMINPAVNLMSSVNSMDKLLEENIPGGMNNVDAFFDEFFSELAKAYRDQQEVDFSDDDFFYSVYKNRKGKIRMDIVRAMIGMAFRLSSTNMVFTSDVMSQTGYVVPKGLVLARYDSLTDYFKVNNRFGLLDYYKDFLLPFYLNQRNGVTKENAMDHISLKGLEGYLRQSQKIGVMTNADDIILTPKDVDYIRNVFGSRAKIFPRGGHGGNIAHRVNVREMIKFFKN
jgi:hypothetical protein